MISSITNQGKVLIRAEAVCSFFTNIRCFLLLLTVILTGCPPMDPYTQSIIENNTQDTAHLVVELDMQRYGVHDKETAVDLLPDWLQEFTLGEGVTLVSSTPQTLSGVFEIRAGGSMVIHEALGKGPHFKFKKLTIANNGRTRVFETRSELGQLFQKAEGTWDHLYTLKIADL